MGWWNIQSACSPGLGRRRRAGLFDQPQNRAAANDMVIRSRRELKRAQAVALELEKIAWTVRQSLAKHHASVSRFKERVSRLSDQQQDAAWKDLCREAEEILRPTLQLATQIANAYDEIRQQSANLMTFTEVRTDPLTGVNNRRGLDDALNTQVRLDEPLQLRVLAGHVRHRPFQAGQRQGRAPARRPRSAGACPAVGRMHSRDRHRRPLRRRGVRGRHAAHGSGGRLRVRRAFAVASRRAAGDHRQRRRGVGPRKATRRRR